MQSSVDPTDREPRSQPWDDDDAECPYADDELIDEEPTSRNRDPFILLALYEELAGCPIKEPDMKKLE
jgi:hypothetical protein